MLGFSLVLFATISWAYSQRQWLDHAWEQEYLRWALQDAALEAAVRALGGEPSQAVFITSRDGQMSFQIRIGDELAKQSLYTMPAGELRDALAREEESLARALTQLRYEGHRGPGLGEENFAKALQNAGAGEGDVTCAMQRWTGLSRVQEAAAGGGVRNSAAAGTILHIEVVPAGGLVQDLGYDLIVVVTGRRDQPLAIAGDHYFRPSVRRMCR
jgi:hypothetical protein